MSEPCCPRCHEPVRLPTETPAADATVRCPWCGAHFAIGEVTAALPPALELVGVDIDVDDAEAFRFADEPATYSAAEPTDEPHTAAFAGANLATRPRAQRQSVSPVKMLVQWVGGGVAGIAIALGILYALDKTPYLGFWPFDGSISNSTAVRQPRDFAVRRPQPQSQPQPPPSQELSPPDFRTMNSDAAELQNNTPDSSDSAPADRPAAENPPAAEDDAEPQQGSDPQRGSDRPSGTSEIADPDTPSPQGDEAGGDEAGVMREAATLSPAVLEMIADAEQASIELSQGAAEGAAEERAARRARLYTAMARLGESADTSAREHFQQLFAQLRDSGQLTELGAFGRNWYGLQQRPSDGLFTTGVLRQNERGDYLLDWGAEPFLALSNVDQAVTDPAAMVGQQVALLGSIDGTPERPSATVAHLEKVQPRATETDAAPGDAS